MLYRFPPVKSDLTDHSFIYEGNRAFAKLKIETRAGKRTVLLTEHTFIFVIKGKKLLHFPEKTVELAAGQVMLLKKGIYVMAEYVAAGLGFEALMLFLPNGILQAFQLPGAKPASGREEPYTILTAGGPVGDFKDQLRRYFDHRPDVNRELARVKQTEILLLLIAAGHAAAINHFTRSALRSAPEDIGRIVADHALQPVTLPELARLCNRSLASFKRDFRRHYATSPKAWINQQRLTHAVMLLDHTDRLVTEIALSCGFESTSYFIRIFKKCYGVTPQMRRAEMTII